MKYIPESEIAALRDKWREPTVHHAEYDNARCDCADELDSILARTEEREGMPLDRAGLATTIAESLAEYWKGSRSQLTLLSRRVLHAVLPFFPARAEAAEAQLAVMREVLKAADDLCFECDGILQTKAPSRETYNRAFLVIKAAKDMLADAASLPAKGETP